MKKILFALSVFACAASAPVAATAAVNCVSFSPAGYCDGMQFDSKKKATWVNYDCLGSSGKQTTAAFKAGSTTCEGAMGCDPSATYGWQALNWQFDKKKSTGTLTGVSGGVEMVLLQDSPVTVTAGACTALANPSGVSSLAR